MFRAEAVPGAGDDSNLVEVTPIDETRRNRENTSLVTD